MASITVMLAVAQLTVMPLLVQPAAAAVPSISITDMTVTEGNAGTATAVFTVTQSIRGKSSVHYATANNTAISPADYLAQSGIIKFSGRRLSHTISITVVGDTIDEPNETFFVKLSNAKGATIADDTGVGTISDDDPPPSVSVPSTLSVPEGNSGD
jgi:large repetitive protein